MNMEVAKKILLIDDDEDDWLLFREAVEAVDNTLVCDFFQDAIDAIRYLSNHLHELPDRIFLDLNMPRMNGKECLREVKRRKELAHIPVIILSTSNLESDVLHAKMLGAAYFVTKPHRLTLLVEALNFILKRSNEALPAALYKWVKVI
jgi:CheY-like chemotaxis protein